MSKSLTADEREVLQILLGLRREPLCPKCGLRPIDTYSDEGWCAKCSAARLRELERKRRYYENRTKQRKRKK